MVCLRDYGFHTPKVLAHPVRWKDGAYSTQRIQPNAEELMTALSHPNEAGVFLPS